MLQMESVISLRSIVNEQHFRSSGRDQQSPKIMEYLFQLFLAVIKLLLHRDTITLLIIIQYSFFKKIGA